MEKNKWQVGDSAQQNGVFNMEIGKGKRNLLQQKIKSGHKFQLTRKDLIWLLCFAWLKSFGRDETNKTAHCERGWNPLNRSCLDDYEIQNASVQLEKEAIMCI
jgi:hypothetical protein